VFGIKQKEEHLVHNLQDIVIQDIEEDLLCMDYNENQNLIAAAGALGVGYVYNLGPSTGEIDVDVQQTVRLTGHFKPISQIRFVK
jgi:hypothetical protein